MDKNGKIIMKQVHEVQLAPNGNGAIFEAIRSNMKVQNLIRSMDFVQVIGVDKILNRILDPTNLGFASIKDLDCSTKVLPKASPEEKVGVLCYRNGKPDIVEYLELTKEQSEKKYPDDPDRLYFDLGNILIFMFKAEKLLELCQGKIDNLYHKAFKKIEHLCPQTGVTVKPEAENGYKFELYMHNSLPFCQKVGALLVDRAENFGPVKNANDPQNPGLADTPFVAKEMMCTSHKKWVEKILDSDFQTKFPNPSIKIEVDLMLSYQGEGELFE